MFIFRNSNLLFVTPFHCLSVLKYIHLQLKPAGH